MQDLFALSKHLLRSLIERCSPTSSAHLRKVASIVGHLSLEEADCLYRLAPRVAEGCIIETGTFRGRSTVALVLGFQHGYGAPVYTLDPHEPFTGELGGQFGPQDRVAFLKNMLCTNCASDVRLVNLSSEAVTPGWQTPVGLIWIDGDHSYCLSRRQRPQSGP